MSELFLKGIGGDGEDLDKTHRDVQTRVRAVTPRWLHHAYVDEDGVTLGNERGCDDGVISLSSTSDLSLGTSLVSLLLHRYLRSHLARSAR